MTIGMMETSCCLGVESMSIGNHIRATSVGVDMKNIKNLICENYLYLNRPN